MSNIDLKFPSGRTLKDAKKDAKRLAKKNNIPLHQALDEICKENDLQFAWHDAVVYLKSSLNITVNRISCSENKKHFMISSNISNLHIDVRNMSNIEEKFYCEKLAYTGKTKNELLEIFNLPEVTIREIIRNCRMSIENKNHPVHYRPRVISKNGLKKLLNNSICYVTSITSELKNQIQISSKDFDAEDIAIKGEKIIFHYNGAASKPRDNPSFEEMREIAHKLIGSDVFISTFSLDSSFAINNNNQNEYMLSINH